MPFDHLPLTEARETIKEDDVCRVLRRAAQDIRNRGLARHTGQDPFGRRCVVNAVSCAV